MTRKKVKLAWIGNGSARRASLKKRSSGLLKKVSELTTLCGIEACLIIYSPDESEPIVWPSLAKVKWQLEQFWEMPELERSKKTTNQETYLEERVIKAQEQLKKFQRRSKEVETGYLMHQTNRGKGLDEFSLDALQGMSWLVEEKMKEILNHIKISHQAATESLLSDHRLIDMINNNEHKSGGDIGLPCQPFADIAAQDLGLSRNSFGGNSTVATNMGLPLYGNFRCSPADKRLLPPPSFRPQGGASDIRPSLHGGGSSTFGPFASDIGLGLHPFRHIGNSSSGSEVGLPFWPFQGASSKRC